MVCHRYVFKIPQGLCVEKAAPLLCAGVTVYSPLKKISRGSDGTLNIGVVGIGGLGHLALQFSKAMGHHTYAISHSPGKKDESMKIFGASFFINSSSDEDMRNASEKVLI